MLSRYCRRLLIVAPMFHTACIFFMETRKRRKNGESPSHPRTEPRPGRQVSCSWSARPAPQSFRARTQHVARPDNHAKFQRRRLASSRTVGARSSLARAITRARGAERRRHRGGGCLSFCCHAMIGSEREPRAECLFMFRRESRHSVALDTRPRGHFPRGEINDEY
jgi:hypothetical protein